MCYRRRQWLVALVCGGMLLCLILDSKTALIGATDGIHICLQTLVPVLLPYIFLSALLSNAISAQRLPLLNLLGKMCGIPTGAESIFLLGLLSGYPVGARLVSEAYRNGEISESSAKRMLAFCSNAGPSFILGILSCAFTSKIAPWLLWFIHIISAILVAMLIPDRKHSVAHVHVQTKVDPASILLQSIKALSLICAWVILFRTLIAFIHTYLDAYLPPIIQTILIGLLELANGCMCLERIPNEAVRFITCSCILAFGGLCVMMQTGSLCGTLGVKTYGLGKILQMFISFVMSIPLAYWIYNMTPNVWFFVCTVAILLIITLAIMTSHKGRKNSSISLNVGI